MVLGKLKSLWQIGIVVDFLIKGALRLNRAIEGKAGEGSLFKGLLTELRQCARQPEADGTGIPIRFVTGPVGAVTEQLGCGVELNVYFKTDDRFILHAAPPPCAVDESFRPIDNSRGSSSRKPISCTPISTSEWRARDGTWSEGWPVTLAGSVSKKAS